MKKPAPRTARTPRAAPRRPAADATATAAASGAAEPAPTPSRSATLQLGITGQERATPNGAALPLPGGLRPVSRSGDRAEADPLLAGLVVTRRIDMDRRQRSRAADGARSAPTRPPEGHELLALETPDGHTLYVRADALAAAVARLRPEAVQDGVVNLARFGPTGGASRGVPELLWKAVSTLRLPQDALLDEAARLAREWAEDWLGDQVEAAAYAAASHLGSKALVWSIESRLAGNEGLYQWRGERPEARDRCEPGDQRLRPMANGQPALVLIHGVASTSAGSFGDLQRDADTWATLQRAFPGGIFGFEHRSFSASPVENAIALLNALPDNARFSLLTHSRGGLIGDLLCLDSLDATVIGQFRFVPPQDASPIDRLALERASKDEQERLRTLAKRLKTKPFQVERYLRVASPAQGTRLLSDNLDVALSDLLGLLQWGGSGAVRLAAGALAGPAAAVVAGQTASSWLGVLQRLVLEIAARRIHPQHMPGIAAMRTDAPMARLLAHPGSGPRKGLQMAVIAGDTEFQRLGLSHLGRRLANLFCDWRLFDQQDNDLVVDTDAMFAGLAPRAGARYLLDQGEEVTHFNYFSNPLSQGAVRDWLTHSDLQKTLFQPLQATTSLPWSALHPAANWTTPPTRGTTRGTTHGASGQRGAQAAGGGTAAGRPLVILIPDFMQSRLVGRLSATGRRSASARLWPDLERLAQVGLAPLADRAPGRVLAEAPLEDTYGELAQHLAHSHTVLPFAYDWRLPLAASASALKALLERAAHDHPGQPIRLLAHGSGGLLVRRLMLDHPARWQSVLDSGGRLLTLGTPHRGSHAMLHALLGKERLVRELAMVTPGGLQPVLDTLARWPGLLALLPCPVGTASDPSSASAGHAGSIQDTPDDSASAWTDASQWARWQRAVTDRWFGPGIVGQPAASDLREAAAQWQALHAAANGPDQIDPQRVLCVHGQSEATPCGVALDASGRLQLRFTAHGDGVVTWDSAQWPGPERPGQTWLMPVPHDELTRDPHHFDALTELLESGHTERLGCLPVARVGCAEGRRAERSAGAHPGPAGSDASEPAAHSFVMEAGPPVVPTEASLGRGGAGSRRTRRERQHHTDRLRVSVRAGDLMYADQPVMCGHYVGDAISGAEASLDQLLQGGLSERERLGQYAAAVSSSVVVLRAPNAEELARQTLRGAVIVGLGEFNGQISGRTLTDTVRAGAIRYLLHLRDAIGRPPGQPVKLYSLLLGWSSNASLNIGEAVSAVVLGVLEANQQVRQAAGRRREQARAITELRFLELYRDTAISAAHEVALLPERLGNELRRFDWQLDPSRVLETAAGVRERLSVLADQGHWSRFIVTDPDADAAAAAPHTAAHPVHAAAPPAAADTSRPPTGDSPPPGAHDAPGADTRRYPERLKFVYLSRRARAESVDQQRQPGLIEDLIRAQRFETAHNARLGNTLFQLMVPLDFKGLARENARTLLVLDSYAASLPWELMQIDSQPIALRAPLLRQLATPRHRQTVPTADALSACLIVNPSSDGFRRRFPLADVDALDDLRGAAEEGSDIENLLTQAGWSQVTPATEQMNALEVFTRLYERPYKVLVIAAHGLFEALAHDGKRYTGAVLSDGLLLTAEEVRQMETVPDLVFLSCCHLGNLSHGQTLLSEPNRLAYSLSQQLIEMGVRCVVAAGWAVDDEAARTFASTFFQSMVDGDPFGEAIFEARKQTHDKHRTTNTWGAYQAYGDPSYRLQRIEGPGHTGPDRRYVAPEELLFELERRLQSVQRPGNRPQFANEKAWIEGQLKRCPTAWAERPELLQAQARLYAELGVDGFEAARSAYLRAIQRDDRHGLVSVKSIEQLANLEVRTGAQLARLDQPEPASAAALREGIMLIGQAIARIEALNRSVAGPDGENLRNTERAALLGSAYKRLTVARSWQPDAPWITVRETLQQAARCYRSGILGDPAQDPYNTLNALALDWLCQPLDGSAAAVADAVALALRCGEQARRSHADKGDFWSAVMSADAQMTAWFMSGQWPGPGDLRGDQTAGHKGRAGSPASPSESDATLLRLYLHATQNVPQSGRQWDSVTKQWRLLARLLRLRHAATDNAVHDNPEAQADTEANTKADIQAGAQALAQVREKPAAWLERAQALDRLADHFRQGQPPGD